MKQKNFFWYILIFVSLGVISFWTLAFFLTENKPIHVPLFVEIDFKNYWYLFPLALLNYYLLLKSGLNKKVKLVLFYCLSFSLIVVLNSFKQSLNLTTPLIDQNNYYQDALEITNLRRFIASFDRRTFFHHLHTRTHPPGPVLFHYFLNQLFPRLTIINALAIILISSLNIFVVYKISSFFKNINKNFNLILLLSSPGFLLYSATCMDAVFAFLISISIYFLLILTRNYSLKNIILASLWIFLATFFTYASIIIPLFSLFFIILNKFKNKKYILSQIFIIFLVLFIYFILNITTGFKPMATFFSAKNFNTMLMPDIFMTFKRYIYSISANLVEYIIFLGLPILSLLILTIINLVKDKKEKGRFNYYLAFLIPMIFLNLGGIYKTGQVSGETGRIWLFLTPLIIAGLKINNKKDLVIGSFLSFGQAIIIQIAFNTYW